MSDSERWRHVESFLDRHLLPHDTELDAALAANAAAGLPAYDVSPSQGKLLYLLARLLAARRILEIGTLGGYSTIWLARALADGGEVVTLEVDPQHAAVARANFARAGVADRITVRVGAAVKSLAQLATDRLPPFDLVFIDADKRSNVAYLDGALALTRPGSAILFDNVVRDGQICDPADDDPSVRGVRDLLARLAREPRIEATALQTVGSKGWDGFLLARVRDARPPG